jgi:hypothetical protein
MDETRDTGLGRELEAFGEPEHGPEYWRNVRVAVAQAKSEAASEAPSETRRPGFASRLRAAFVPRRVRLALAAAAVAAVAVAVILVGVPGTEGPQLVSAQQVLRNVLVRYATVQTWRADSNLTAFDRGAWEKYHAYITRRISWVQAADGSYRTSYGWVTAAGHRLTGGEPGTAVYNAATDKGSPWYDTEQQTWVQETNPPLGPPDAGTIPLIDIGTTIRSLASSRTLRLDETVADGRPAWTLTCTKGELAGLPPSSKWPVYTVTVDKQTWMLLGVREEQGGRVTFDIRYHDVRVNGPLPDDVFVPTAAPPGAPVKRVDLGFHRMTLDRAATAPGVRPLVPSFAPAGFKRSQVAVADRAQIVREINGKDVRLTTRHAFALQYRRGFDWLTVSTRTVPDRRYHIEMDLCDEFDQAWSRQARIEVPIASGAFAGVTARILAVSTTSAPHLWAEKDGVLLTIAGMATADELLAVAESLYAYPGPSPASE